MLADFIAECTILDEAPDAQDQSALNDTSLSARPWILHVDGSSIPSVSGVGIILTNSKGKTIEYALHFIFSASNNEAEYEALIIGLKLASVLKISKLWVFSDS